MKTRSGENSVTRASIFQVFYPRWRSLGMVLWCSCVWIALAGVAVLATLSPLTPLTGLAPAFAQQPLDLSGGASDAEPTPGVVQRQILTFLTTDDFPPFNSLDEDGVLTGLNVDLARAICLDLGLKCIIKVVTWDQLFPTLNRGKADGVIAAHRVTAEALKTVSFTDRYFYTPGRFATRKDAQNFAATPTGLNRRTVGVVQNSPHEAYMTAFFRNTLLKRYATPEMARSALMNKSIDAVFGDGISLVFWVNGTTSNGCCTLRGGPYMEAKFFGDGIGIAVRKSDVATRTLLNEGLARVRKRGRLLELVDRYFPLRVS